MSNAPQSSSMTTTRIIDIAMVALIAVVFLLALVGASAAGIAVGTLLPPPIGIIGLVIALISAIQRKSFGAVDLGLVVFVAVVFGLVAAGMAQAAIALGVLVPPVIGLVIGAVALVNSLRQGGTDNPDADFSHFAPEDERAFVPQERHMRAISRSGLTAALIVCGVFIVSGLAIFFSYSACTKYCERPPSGCKTEAQIADFKRTCESTCGALETQKGKDYVEVLTGCAFANSSVGPCEEPTKIATEKGLWCISKD